MIVFAHIKFGLVRIQGNGVNGGWNPPPSERVFQIPVQIGLRIKGEIIRFLLELVQI